MTPNWIENTEKENEQGSENITALELKAALIKSQKSESLGTDKVPHFLLNALSQLHAMFTCLLNEIMQKPEKTEWMCKGTTYLLAKNSNTKDPKNY